MNYYFIDYENVHLNGFVGIENLGENDFLHIMYTEQCKAFPFALLDKLCKQHVNLDLHCVSIGMKDALDFQLSSYLGYIIAKNEEQKSTYYIVSNDKGFNHVLQFWRARGVNIERVINFRLDTDLPKPIPINMTEEQPAANSAAATKIAELQPEVKQAAVKKEKKEINTATKKELLEYITKEEYSDKILQIINSYKSKSSIKNGFDKEFRDNQKSTALYKKLKPFLTAKGKT
ncbi:MAG: PIN domain-containing protein [Firmicutes bacterium]|nr:PIN domain-containing protein [[Eubacterium] siraeum]MCM1488339.1 PIN domain-containing protein [Bacillota bacterium]